MGELNNLTLRRATRVLNGASFDAIIHNGSYFLADIGVYEDGIVDCWGGVDLKLFKRKVSSGWVRTSIPEGAILSAHYLGDMTVTNAEWAMTPRKLVRRVKTLVKEMNPTMTNLYDMKGDASDRSGPIPMAKAARLTAASWRPDEGSPLVPKPIHGIAGKAFWRTDNAVHVVTVSLFDDDRTRITGAGTPEEMTLDALREDERLGAATKGDRVHIAALCSFDLSEINLTVPRDGFLAQLEIDRDKYLGRTTPLDETVAAFKAYRKNPTKQTLEELRVAYESVPEHMRIYCGDMDTKDIPIRIALYGESEIEGWTHYAAAKAMGQTLPSMKVPKPRDE